MTSNRFRTVAIAALIVVSAARAMAAPARLGDLPASFAGVLPCTYCAGIRYEITLLPGGAFIQRKSILREDRDESLYAIGTWTLSENGRRLTLEGDRDGATTWEVESRALVTPAGGELARTAAPLVLEPRVELRGTFRVLADAALFRDCRSGLRWPVERSGEYRALERDYLARRLAPGAELLVALRGRVAPRSRADGDGTEPTLIVERFLRAMPGEACEGRAPGSGLTENRWRAVAIGGRAVTVAGHQSEPWLHLDSKSGRVTGSGGCNRISGTFEVGGPALRFSRMSSTRMACRDMETETAFLRALDSVRGYRIAGRSLVLLNGAWATALRLEEANLR